MFCTFWFTKACKFFSHLASWLRTRRFSEPTFNPPEPQIIGKTQWIATFLPFRAPASSFFSLFLWSSHFFSSPLWLFPPLLSHLSILSEVWLLSFLRANSWRNAHFLVFNLGPRNVANITTWGACLPNGGPKLPFLLDGGDPQTILTI